MFLKMTSLAWWALRGIESRLTWKSRPLRTAARKIGRPEHGHALRPAVLTAMISLSPASRP